MKSPSFEKLSIVCDPFMLHFKLIMCFYCKISIYTSGWKNKHVQSRMNMRPLSVCLTNQAVRMLEIPVMWYPVFGNQMTTAVTWANKYFLNMQSHSKLRWVLPKLMTSWENSLQPKHEQIIIFIKMTYNSFLFFSIYRWKSSRPLVFEKVERCQWRRY